VIELKDICRTFVIGDQQVHALDHLQLTIDRGEYLSVMGPSGSGKSTMLNILGLLDKPDSGEYWINQTNTSVLPEKQLSALRQQEIGFVFQAYHLIPRLTTIENVELPMVLAGIPAKQRRLKSLELLEKLGLSDRAQHQPYQLSGGQRQRVAIARAIIMKPEILLADEPTGNLDTVSGAEVIHLLEALNNEGITLVIVTHDQNIGQRARRRIRLVDGNIADDAGQSANHGVS
jgi:putative ABC transport system ATP-binding protein